MSPAEFLRRSPLHRVLAAHGAQFVEIAGGAIAANYGNTIEDEATQAKNLGLADLSLLPRTGCKGREALAWLRSQSVDIPDENNQASPQSDGSLVARLADTEALILGEPSGQNELCARVNEALYEQAPSRCYHVPRQDSVAWLLVTGQHAATMFAKLCAVDLREHRFSNGAVAQTSVARMNAIIIRGDRNEAPTLHLLFDSASAEYMWRCLTDAMEEFGGKPVGHNTVLSL